MTKGVAESRELRREIADEFPDDEHDRTLVFQHLCKIGRSRRTS